MPENQLSKPPLGIGTWAWGDRMFWGWGRGGYSKADLRAALDACLAAGVTLFDTAEVYGMGTSERMLGELSKDASPPVRIASKCFPFPWRVSARFLRGALRRSLKRLGSEHIALYQMHFPGSIVSIKSWMNAMADAVEDGFIEQVGVSNYNIQQTEAAHAALAARGIPLASNQILHSLLDRRVELNGLIQRCHELGVTVIAYSPIAQGLLSGKYSRQNPPPGIRGMRTSTRRLARAERLVEELGRIGAAHGGKTPVQVALNWCIAKGTVPIPGVKNRHQAEEALSALGWKLKAKEVEDLDAASQAA